MGMLEPGIRSEEIKSKLDKASNFMKDDKFLEDKFMESLDNLRFKRIE
jgi:hypothetical protein